MGSTQKVYDGQMSFAGGVRMSGYDPGPDEAFYLKNVEIRENGYPATRRAVAQAFPSQLVGTSDGFYFNQDNAKYNDSEHTGFWFPFDFVQGYYINPTANGMAHLPGWDEQRFLFVSSLIVWMNRSGRSSMIPTVTPLTSDMQISFVQALNKVVMFRGDDYLPLYWDGSDTGFVAFPTTGSGDDVPNCIGGIYVSGRLWVWDKAGNVAASDIFDIFNYDYVNNLFSVAMGDGDELLSLEQFNDDIILAGKENSLHAIRGVNSGESDLSSTVVVEVVETNYGIVGKGAWATSGENVLFFSHKGIQSTHRNAEGRMMGREVSLSHTIEPLIERVTKSSYSKIVATTYDNYTMFAVPLDGAPYNNAVIVWDWLAGQNGAWIGYWQSSDDIILSPVAFFRMGGDMVFLCYDGKIRKFFKGFLHDTLTLLDDIRTFEEDTFYRMGSLVKIESGGAYTIWRATTITNYRYLGAILGWVHMGPYTDPAYPDYWTEVTTSEDILSINVEVMTKWYDHGDAYRGKMYGSSELVLGHQIPKISMTLEESYGMSSVMFTDTQYSVWAKDNEEDPYDPQDSTDEAKEPWREDYTAIMKDVGPRPPLVSWPDLGWEPTYLPESGLPLNVFRIHDLHFIPITMSGHRFRLHITNTQGRVKIMAVRIPATLLDPEGKRQ